MKPSLGKVAPGDHSRSAIGGDKAACHEPRSDDRHDRENHDIPASAKTGLKACMPQNYCRAGIAGGNDEGPKNIATTDGDTTGSIAPDNTSAAITSGA